MFLLVFAGVVLSHWTLLRLPYFWDEAGYYVPAALDFFRSGTLIPEFTNAHPPLPNVVLGSLWHLFGYHIVVTRLTACAFAAAALTAIFYLAQRLLGSAAALAVTLLTALYPIWFAQSSLAHADIFAAAFTLAGFAGFLSAPEMREAPAPSSPRRLLLTGSLFCLSVVSKETAVLQPAALAGYAGLLALQLRPYHARSAAFRRWALVLASPIPVLACWYAYHFAKTGLIFGNPVYLRYNATANFSLAHVWYAFRIRALHLFWQRNLWVPLLLALACVWLPGSGKRTSWGLPRRVVTAVALLIVVNWIAFSILGGALLTRYLLPVYPLELLLCVGFWKAHTLRWPWLAALAGTAFLSAIWMNPWNFFAPEDNLTYRDLIRVHQDAIAFLEQHYPGATVLTPWPAATELYRPELGYTHHRFKLFEIEDFSDAELARAEEQPGRYDTALVFTTHYLAPGFQNFLLRHAQSRASARYLRQIDRSPAELAARLHGHLVWQENRNGEWAAIIRFDRSYTATR